MAVLDGVDIVYIERCRAPGPREIDLNLHVGSRLPAYCTSMGKVLLAFAPELPRLVDAMQLTRRGPNTITAKRKLLKELEQVRERGLAVNNEELAYGLRSIAAPVWSQTGDVLAAINIAVHRSLVSMDELLEDLAPALVDTASEISAHTGLNGDANGVR
jgi:IclR family pca regulon transcriptional regulator